LTYEKFIRFLKKYDLEMNDLVYFLTKLVPANTFLLAEAKALIECEKIFGKEFIRTGLYESIDLKSKDDEIWVEVKEIGGLAPGSLTLSRSQIMKLLNGIKQGKEVFIAVVSLSKMILIDLREYRKYLEDALKEEEGMIKLLVKLNEHIEKELLKIDEG